MIPTEKEKIRRIKINYNDADTKLQTPRLHAVLRYYSETEIKRAERMSSVLLRPLSVRIINFSYEECVDRYKFNSNDTRKSLTPSSIPHL